MGHGSGIGALSAVASIVIASSASAAMLDEGTYQLCNHPDGNSAAPNYGLILSELYNVSGGNDLFSFDFEHDESDVKLVWDGEYIEISGPVYGGRDIGDDWADDIYKGVYQVYFKYDLNFVQAVIGDDDLFVENEGDSGTIMTPLGDTIDLSSKSNGSYAFRFGDEDDDAGHRGFDGISGWGWLMHGNGPHKAPTDWLFTAKLIPSPGSIALIMAAVPFVVARRRRAA